MQFCMICAGFRAADEGFAIQPSSARASVSSSDGFGSRVSRHQHGDSFGGGQPSLPLPATCHSPDSQLATQLSLYKP